MQATALDVTPYTMLTDEECEERIVAAKRALGDCLVILGHHYQRDEVFRHADLSGDSLKLSREAANSKAEYIVFCGVHFMAEVADILSRPLNRSPFCRIWLPAVPWPTWPTWPRWNAPGRSSARLWIPDERGNAGYLYQFCSRSQGILW